MSKKELPHFVIYQPNETEFHICLRVDAVYFRWRSTYPPSLDVRFPREVARIGNLPVKNRSKKNIFDEGTYTIAKSDTDQSAQSKILDGVEKKSFSFILNGKILKGRFIIKKGNFTVLQKFKDKYAKEEDVLSRDLIRTIHTMVPDYDEKKVKLNTLNKPKKKEAKEEIEETQELTADAIIGNIVYHFSHYTSANQPDLCIVTNANNEVLVFKKVSKQWTLLMPVNRAALKKADAFSEHAKVLFD